MTTPTPEERARTAREIVERFLDSHGWEVVGYGPRWGQDPRDAAAELAHAIAAALAARDARIEALRALLAEVEPHIGYEYARCWPDDPAFAAMMARVRAELEGA